MPLIRTSPLVGYLLPSRCRQPSRASTVAAATLTCGTHSCSPPSSSETGFVGPNCTTRIGPLPFPSHAMKPPASLAAAISVLKNCPAFGPASFWTSLHVLPPSFDTRYRSSSGPFSCQVKFRLPPASSKKSPKIGSPLGVSALLEPKLMPPKRLTRNWRGVLWVL